VVIGGGGLILTRLSMWENIVYIFLFFALKLWNDRIVISVIVFT